MPLSTEDAFFAGKRPWSRIKDSILGSYMPAYLRKVARLGKRIVLIDCFAGPGTFQDGTKGSPLIMCEVAEKHARGAYVAIFVNKERRHHAALKSCLPQELITQKTVIPILGDSRVLLEEVKKVLRDQTLFIYLDPFGLRGCEFNAIKALLQRGSNVSTEILVNLSMPTFHRLAARHAVSRGRGETAYVKKFHSVLDQVFGGDYWRKYAFDDRLLPEEKERKLIAEYHQKLRELLPYASSCPVQESAHSRIKYFVTFCSRHADAMVLMNDIMCNAYNKYLHEMALIDLPLLAPIMPDWRAERTRIATLLRRVIIDEVKTSQGRTRKRVWESIAVKHFMLFLSSEYKDLVQELVEEGVLQSPPRRPTKRLNDDCVLQLGKKA